MRLSKHRLAALEECYSRDHAELEGLRLQLGEARRDYSEASVELARFESEFDRRPLQVRGGTVYLADGNAVRASDLNRLEARNFADHKDEWEKRKAELTREVEEARTRLTKLQQRLAEANDRQAASRALLEACREHIKKNKIEL